MASDQQRLMIQRRAAAGSRFPIKELPRMSDLFSEILDKRADLKPLVIQLDKLLDDWRKTLAITGGSFASQGTGGGTTVIRTSTPPQPPAEPPIFDDEFHNLYLMDWMM